MALGVRRPKQGTEKRGSAPMVAARPQGGMEGRASRPPPLLPKGVSPGGSPVEAPGARRVRVAARPLTKHLLLELLPALLHDRQQPLGSPVRHAVARLQLKHLQAGRGGCAEAQRGLSACPGSGGSGPSCGQWTGGQAAPHVGRKIPHGLALSLTRRPCIQPAGQAARQPGTQRSTAAAHPSSRGTPPRLLRIQQRVF